jgi:transcriptional regulator with XRE-family HTH domain
MDRVLKLRELRRLRGLTQRAAARLSGIGAKTISSFETGERIDGMTVVQLEQLLTTYGVTLADFFGSSLERELAPWEHEDERAFDELLTALRSLPEYAQSVITEKLHLAIELAHELAPPAGASRQGPTRRAADHRL